MRRTSEEKIPLFITSVFLTLREPGCLGCWNTNSLERAGRKGGRTWGRGQGGGVEEGIHKRGKGGRIGERMKEKRRGGRERVKTETVKTR